MDSLFQIFSPIINKVNGASYVTLNINSSNLTPSQVVQGVNIGNRQVVNAMYVQILGLKEFVIANTPSGGYTLPIASGSTLGGVKIGSGISIAGDGTISVSGGTGTVTSVSVVSANGFAGSVATATTTPAITISTSVTGIIKGNGTAISAAVAGTDYQAPITLTTIGTSGVATFIGNTLNIPQYQAAGTYVTSLSVTTNQGVSGSFTSGATPALTINLGALTGVTSLNGLVVTANTGVITTGTWQGTLISPQFGGTGVNNSTRKITINTNNAAFTFSGAFTLTVPATGTATLGTGATNRIAYWSGTNTVTSSANLTYDGVTFIQNAPTVANFVSAATSNAYIGMNATRQRLGLFQGDVTQHSSLTFEVSATAGGANHMTAFKYGTGAVGNLFSSVPLASLGGFNSGSISTGGGSQPMLFGGEPLYFGRYNTSTAVMMKLTKEGLTIDVASTFSNAASLNALTVATGRSFFGSATAATSTVHVGGSLATGITTKTANYTLTISDYTVIFDGVSLTATLPAANTCSGRIYVLVNRNATTLTTSISFETLTSGVTSTTVTAASSVGLQSNGTSWYQIF